MGSSCGKEAFYGGNLAGRSLLLSPCGRYARRLGDKTAVHFPLYPQAKRAYSLQQDRRSPF